MYSSVKSAALVLLFLFFSNMAIAGTQLAFSVQPTVGQNIDAGVPFDVTVQVLDAQGQLDTAATDLITLTLKDANGGPVDFTTTPANPQNANAGEATFNITITTAGDGYVLSAAANGLTGSGDSNAFNIVPAAANKLVFTTQPSQTVAGAIISPAVVVQVQDEYGNNVTTATDEITLTLKDANGGSVDFTTTPANPQNANAGEATFNITITTAGDGYVLSAAANGLTGSGDSNAFNIVPADANKLVFTTQPGDTVVGAIITPAVVVQVQDEFGNNVAYSGCDVSPVLKDSSGNSVTNGASLSGVGNPTPSTEADGSVAFSNLSVDKQGGYRLSLLNGCLLAYSSSNVFSITATAANVTTSDPTTISSSGVTLHGKVTNPGEPAATYGFIWSQNSSDLTSVPATCNDTSGCHVNGTADANTSAYSYSVGGLTADTTYHYTAYATNAAGTVFGDTIKTFTTAKPSVLAPPVVSAIDVDSAMFASSVTTEGSPGSPAPPSPTTVSGFVWSASSNPQLDDSNSTVSNSGLTPQSATGLSDNTAYYVKAYEQVKNGNDIVYTSYSDATVFHTLRAVLNTSITPPASFEVDSVVCYDVTVTNNGPDDVTLTKGGQVRVEISVEGLEGVISRAQSCAVANQSGSFASSPQQTVSSVWEDDFTSGTPRQYSVTGTVMAGGDVTVRAGASYALQLLTLGAYNDEIDPQTQTPTDYSIPPASNATNVEAHVEVLSNAVSYPLSFELLDGDGVRGTCEAKSYTLTPNDTGFMLVIDQASCLNNLVGSTGQTLIINAAQSTSISCTFDSFELTSSGNLFTASDSCWDFDKDNDGRTNDNDPNPNAVQPNDCVNLNGNVSISTAKPGSPNIGSNNESDPVEYYDCRVPGEIDASDVEIGMRANVLFMASGGMKFNNFKVADGAVFSAVARSTLP